MNNDYPICDSCGLGHPQHNVIVEGQNTRGLDYKPYGAVYFGETVAQASKRKVNPIKKETIHSRIRMGWSIADAFTLPVNRGKKYGGIRSK